jgi:hypothetical protein
MMINRHRNSARDHAHTVVIISSTAHLVPSHFCASGLAGLFVRTTRKQRRSIFLLSCLLAFFTTTNTTPRSLVHAQSAPREPRSEIHLHPPRQRSNGNSKKKKFTSIDFPSFPLEYSGVPASAKHHQLQPHLHRKPLIHHPQTTPRPLSPTTSPLPGTQPCFSVSPRYCCNKSRHISTTSPLTSFHSLPPLHSLRRRLVL